MKSKSGIDFKKWIFRSLNVGFLLSVLAFSLLGLFNQTAVAADNDQLLREAMSTQTSYVIHRLQNGMSEVYLLDVKVKHATMMMICDIQNVRSVVHVRTGQPVESIICKH